jgi:S-adenosylmethionine:tRNA ribosyltransferase-isomerase
VQTELFDYDLPDERIAQEPAAQRDESRLLVVHRAERRLEHRVFREIGDYLGPRDQLFRNAARVLPARIFARRPTGGRVECLLARPSRHPQRWWCLLRPGRKLPPGATFGLPEEFEATVIETSGEGEFLVEFYSPRGETPAELAERLGQLPLPPYIERAADHDPRAEMDRQRYQTVYAQRSKSVAAAAPTAGLHFTEPLIQQLAARGVGFHNLFLHVGLGTFKPIQTDHVEAHPIHREVYEVPSATRAALGTPDSRRIAVGTTSLRALEDFGRKEELTAGPDFLAEADIYVFPPARFRYVDGLITNFHQPRSTLLCLVSAFLVPGSTEGIDWLKEIYAEAVSRRYRFLSYGDAMLIL